MKFNEKLLSIRKKKGLSQEELGLVRLSDYFDMTLDELVKDIDVQDVREKSLTDEKVNSIYLDVENGKAKLQQFIKIFCYIGAALILIAAAGFLLHLLFPDTQWLWRKM